MFHISIPIKNMPKNQEYKSFDSIEGNLFQVLLKNIKTT